MRTKTLTKLVAVVMLFGVSVPVSAATLTEAQITAILNLLTSFGAEQATIDNVSVSLRGGTPSGGAPSPIPSTSAPACVTLKYNLYRGSGDGGTQGEVSKLQRFLGGTVNGYFGPATHALVKSWQLDHGIQTTSTSAGNVGPATRAAMACQ
ncbi:MAG: peptidoglycan-binding protein [Candidatus Taylorbacteria bacterium]|nr:peptidoglycan-binding protein [Candidatus Taylorbacteria bacterium]